LTGRGIADLPQRIIRCLLGIACIASICLPARGEEPSSLRIPIAVADFDYVDTSAEPTNQEAVHAERLRAFTERLRLDLAQENYRIVELPCPQRPCTVRRSTAERLIETARAAGARLLILGGVHKVSTLIQNGKVRVVDVEMKAVVFDRLISFRGDTDESWERAERFVARELAAANLHLR
jgi:hypothetical protein